jgi:hypothetical protein
MKQTTITAQIISKAFELLDQHPEGIQWAELNRQIKASNSTFHPKTINGIVWQLPQKYPDKVYKPSKGLLRLLKYKERS